MYVDKIDHLVLTVANIELTVHFYESVMGMKRIVFGEGRTALVFGNQKINLHEVGREFEPKAANVQSGSADLCFISSTAIEDVIIDLKALGIEMLDGPVHRTGAISELISVYFHDPDGNLIEVSNELGRHIKNRD